MATAGLSGALPTSREGVVLFDDNAEIASVIEEATSAELRRMRRNDRGQGMEDGRRGAMSLI